MTELKNCYVIDTLDNIEKYAGISENFKKACDVIAKGVFESFAPGRHEIAGVDVYVNRDTATYVHQNERRPEFHREYFDIQLPLTGEETVGVGRLDPTVRGDFDEEKDCGFYDETPVEPLTLEPGQFVILHPETCAHAPCCSEDAAGMTIRKIVIKVRK